jgi:hypothetical protein
MRISLANSPAWDDKIPRLEPGIGSRKAGSSPGGSTTTSYGHVGKVRSSFDQRITEDPPITP